MSRRHDYSAGTEVLACGAIGVVTGVVVTGISSLKFGALIGMTFQVSDTDLQTKDFRRVALRHALLSFVFSTGILATTVNLVAGLSSR